MNEHSFFYFIIYTLTFNCQEKNLLHRGGFTDPLLICFMFFGKLDPPGQNRLSARDKGKALAGKSTFNRLELTPEDASPKSYYQKIVIDTKRIDQAIGDGKGTTADGAKSSNDE